MTARDAADRRVAEWIRAGFGDVPTTPSVDAAVVRLRRTRQRPTWLVLVASPSSVVVGRPGLRRDLVLVMVLLLLVAALLATALAGGLRSRPDPRPAIVPPNMPSRSTPPSSAAATPFPSLRVTPAPDGSGSTASATAAATPSPSSQVTVSELGGFSVRYPGSWEVLQFPYGHPEEPGLSLMVMPFLAADIPTELIVIRFALADRVITLPDRAGVERRLFVESLVSLQQATGLGSGLQPTDPVDVDGFPGLVVVDDGGPTLLVAHDGRAYVVGVSRFLTNGRRETLQTVIDGWHWTD